MKRPRFDVDNDANRTIVDELLTGLQVKRSCGGDDEGARHDAFISTSPIAKRDSPATDQRSINFLRQDYATDADNLTLAHIDSLPYSNNGDSRLCDLSCSAETGIPLSFFSTASEETSQGEGNDYSSQAGETFDLTAHDMFSGNGDAPSRNGLTKSSIATLAATGELDGLVSDDDLGQVEPVLMADSCVRDTRAIDPTKCQLSEPPPQRIKTDGSNNRKNETSTRGQARGVFNVEELLAKWRCGRSTWYLVKWEGFNDEHNEWVKGTKRNISRELVHAFESNFKGNHAGVLLLDSRRHGAQVEYFVDWRGRPMQERSWEKAGTISQARIDEFYEQRKVGGKASGSIDDTSLHKVYPSVQAKTKRKRVIK